ncbi:TetR/AcrR family transcriptional regulator [Streptacidiphilus pinicola]|uniref:TetR/AcrR family transcriptional regulator n=1 Tax=Streptacidiphilus pinicola TaxID=2219663 RepID=A0A2X0IW38_9ACTN|nr:TetR/AcrR family transcriptional regulator [Streptacidiphilus pinicola]RAG87681.1 TetR/AcrR family transcriptional regulator [Streptacidiphilus pinicola]
MRPAGQNALLEAARQEFAERGFGSASIRNIAARAGMSLSAMYHYYSGKQELLHALLDEGMDRYFGSVTAELTAVGGDDAAPADRLGAVVAATTRFRAEHATRSNILLLEERSLEPERLEHYSRRQADATNLFREPIDAGIASGEFHTPYPDEARRGVIAMCNAVAQWYRPDGALTLDVLVDRHVELALTLVEYRPQRSFAARGR